MGFVWQKIDRMRVFTLLLVVFSYDLSFAHPQQPPHSKAAYKVPTEAVTLGSGKHQYTLIPGWGIDSQHPKVGDCHALVQDKSGLIYLANTSLKNCIVVFTPEGKVHSSWGDFCKTAHGLSIVEENGREVLFIADSGKNQVVKTTLTGDILMTLNEPTETGLYERREDFKPSKTMHLPNGDFYVIDGYGKNYIHRYDRSGKYLSSFGGTIGKGEAQLKKWGPHGGDIDFFAPENPTILLALSDQQKSKRFTLDGNYIETIPMTGGNPRDILFTEEAVYIPHLGDAWPKNRTSPGIISVHERKTLKLITTLGGSGDGYKHGMHTFLHPHGLLITENGDLYLGQYASGKTYPLKFKKTLITP